MMRNDRATLVVFLLLSACTPYGGSLNTLSYKQVDACFGIRHHGERREAVTREYLSPGQERAPLAFRLFDGVEMDFGSVAGCKALTILRLVVPLN